MNAAVIRRARLLRIREIEHRAAAARMAEGQRKLAALLDMDRRLKAMRLELGAEQGQVAAHALHANWDLAARLEQAGGTLMEPTRQAEASCARLDRTRLDARRKEEGMARLHGRTLAAAAKDAALRADANRPFRTQRKARLEPQS